MDKGIKAAVAMVVAGMAVAAQAQEVVKIGTMSPLSGPQAHYGKDNVTGVRFAVDDLNAKGVTIGGKKIKFEVVTEDDAADPKQGTAAAQKLCDEKVAAVAGILNSGVAIPSSKIFNDCGVPFITGAATNPELTRPGYPGVFRIIANDNALGAALAGYAAETLKLKNVAVIDDRTAYGQGLANVFKKDAGAKGVNIVASEFTNDKATDFMAILTAIKAKKPDAIFYGGMDAQAGPMLRQMVQLGLTNVKFFGGDGICTSELAKLAAGTKTLENVVCADGGASIAKMPGGVEWKKRYDAKYPGVFQVYSPYFYDATMLLVDAMKRADSTDPKKFLPELKKSDYSGVTAKIVFQDNGELKTPLYTLSHYVAGVKKPIGE